MGSKVDFGTTFNYKYLHSQAQIINLQIDLFSIV